MEAHQRIRRYLLTGGAGFIGSRLANQLASNPANLVWVYDSLHPQVHGASPTLNLDARVRFVKGSVCHADEVQGVVKDCSPQVVVHLAAETGTGQSHDEIARYCDVNVMGTAHLLEAIRHHAPLCERIVLPSSRAIYGEGLYHNAAGIETVPSPRSMQQMQAGRFEPEANGVRLTPVSTHEETPAAPASVYASTKLMQEHLVVQASETASWKATILRFQNVYGAGQSLNNPYTGVLSIFAAKLLSGQNLSIFEDGRITRDFVHVNDVVDAVARSCQIDLPAAVRINVGSGAATTILDAAKLLSRICGRSADAYRVTGEFRAGDVRHAVADTRRAKKLLNWEATISLEEGLVGLVNWAGRLQSAA